MGKDEEEKKSSPRSFKHTTDYSQGGQGEHFNSTAGAKVLGNTLFNEMCRDVDKSMAYGFGIGMAQSAQNIKNKESANLGANITSNTLLMGAGQMAYNTYDNARNIPKTGTDPNNPGRKDIEDYFNTTGGETNDHND
jgi:uncharacterized membrane protein YebE (DUF533 family)